MYLLLILCSELSIGYLSIGYLPVCYDQFLCLSSHAFRHKCEFERDIRFLAPERDLGGIGEEIGSPEITRLPKLHT